MNDAMSDASILAAVLGLYPDEIEHRTLDDGRVAVVEPLLFGRARIGVRGQVAGCYDDSW